MRSSKQGYRVAVIGASSLLGKELLTVLEERSFPISRLVTFEADEEEPDLPIVDLRESSHTILADQDVAEPDLDFSFLAARPYTAEGRPSFLRQLEAAPSTHCMVIDLIEGLEDVPGRVLSVPFLERAGLGGEAERGGPDSKLFVSAHPAVIVISSLLLRLAAYFPVQRAVVHVFGPASEIGPRAIEELQKQTVSLLRFQTIPRAVFGAQLAFNLLPRFGRGAGGELADLEMRLRQQLRQYLGSRVPLPALRIFQVPVFYSLAFSLYVETTGARDPQVLAKTLESERVRVRRLSQEPPSQVETAGSSDILVDTITIDTEHPGGVWIWAVTDNLRLAAVNAVEIAESLQERLRS